MLRAVDLFCGAGGSSWGVRSRHREVVMGFDMSPVAGAVYMDNFGADRFCEGLLESKKATQAARELREIDLLVASPECTNHTPARGSRERCDYSRDTAFQVARYAAIINPRWIIVENVVGMRRWRRYREFLARLEKLGYGVTEQVIEASQVGVPQRRRRLFLLCEKGAAPSEVHVNVTSLKPARGIVDLNGHYRMGPLRSDGRAQATLERADRAIDALGPRQPFLLVYYGSDRAGGWQSLDAPLRTVTTLDRFALVKPAPRGHVMRMLQVPELKRAMGMPKAFRFRHGTRRDQIRLVGNAVCPPVMRRIADSLCKK